MLVSSEAMAVECKRVKSNVIIMTCVYSDRECVYNTSAWDGKITKRIDCFPIRTKSE
jgi:hypothetical protein